MKGWNQTVSVEFLPLRLFVRVDEHVVSSRVSDYLAFERKLAKFLLRIGKRAQLFVINCTNSFNF